MAMVAAKTTAMPATRRLLLAMRPLNMSTTQCRVPGALFTARQSIASIARRAYYSTADSADVSSSTTTQSASSSRRSAAAQSVLDRYRSQLDAKARQEGVADVEALREAYADQIAALRRKDVVDTAGKAERKTAAAAVEPATERSAASTEPAAAAQGAEAAAAARPATPASAASADKGGARPLSSFLDLDKSRALPMDELTAVWRLRFAADPLSLCAVIPAATYAAMEAAARARPQFVLPVPHPEQGAEMHFLQWTFDAAGRSTVLFTQLAEFKLRGEFAQPHTTLTHHTDLAAETGAVLMQGQLSPDRGASIDDARWLSMCLQRFYGAWAIPAHDTVSGSAAGRSTGSRAAEEGARNRRLLLQWFAAGDPQFSVERLMEEAERLG